VIDEAHEYFNAQEYKTLSKFTVAYAAKHRHLHDEVILISQALGSIALEFRKRVQDFRYCRNWSKEKFGIFGKGGGFTVYSYLYQFDEQKGSTSSNPEQWKSSFKIDSRAALYNTSIYNRGAEKTKKSPHFGWAILAICTLGIGLVFAVLQLPKLLFSAALPEQNEKTASASPSPQVLSPQVLSPQVPSPQVSLSSRLTLISQSDLTSLLTSMFPDSSIFYDSTNKLLNILCNSSDKMEIISFVANYRKQEVRHIYVEFSGYTALTDGPFSWSNEIPGTASVIADGVKYSLGDETAFGKVISISRFEVLLENSAFKTKLIPILPNSNNFPASFPSSSSPLEALPPGEVGDKLTQSPLS
jgi:hypothetical protein